MNERLKAIIRIVIMLILAVNAALVAKGVSPIGNDALTEVVAYAFAAAMTLYTSWKNNNFTDAAIEAQDILNTIKSLTPDGKEELANGKDEDNE